MISRLAVKCFTEHYETLEKREYINEFEITDNDFNLVRTKRNSHQEIYNDFYMIWTHLNVTFGKFNVKNYLNHVLLIELVR
jgi:hypothetical protein